MLVATIIYGNLNYQILKEGKLYISTFNFDISQFYNLNLVTDWLMKPLNNQTCLLHPTPKSQPPLPVRSTT